MSIPRIGLMLPSSTILPIAKDFRKGFDEGIGAASGEVEVIKSFIGQGGLKQTEDALDKLFQYDEVDMVSGILSGRVTETIAAKFLQRGIPLLVSNLGAYFPDLAKLNPFVFTNSLHLWQHAWALGYWGVKNIGSKGMFLGGMYDAGYSFSHMFYEGMMAADRESQWSFSVPPMPPPGALSDLNVIFPFLEEYQPDFVFAAFCGTEATLFLNEFIRRGWHKRTILTGLPFLMAPFRPVDDDLTIYTTGLPMTNAAEKSFHYLGKQAGNAVAMAINMPGSGLADRLSGRSLSLGGTYFLNGEEALTGQIPILKNKLFAHRTDVGTETIAMAQGPGLTTGTLAGFAGGAAVYWMNPYLCI